MGVLAHVACVAGFLQLSLQEEFASVSVLRPTLRLGRGLGWQHRKEVEEPSKRSWADNTFLLLSDISRLLIGAVRLSFPA